MGKKFLSEYNPSHNGGFMISRSDYIPALTSLIAVHEEVHQKSPSQTMGMQIERIKGALVNFQTNPDPIRPQTVDGVAVLFSKFSHSPLFAYEALSRVGSVLAERCKDEWIAGVRHHIVTSLAEAIIRNRPYEEHSESDLECMYKRVSAQFADVLVPTLQKGRSNEILESVCLIAREIFAKKMAVNDQWKEMEYVQKVLGEELSLTNLIVLQRYGKTCTFAHCTFAAAGDRFVRLFMRLMPNLKSLNLNGCLHVTENAFKEGHHSLESIMIEKTALNSTDFNEALFPRLKIIKKGDGCLVYTLPETISLDQETLQSMRKAHLVVHKKRVLELIINELFSKLNGEGWNVLKELLHTAASNKFQPNNESVLTMVINAMNIFWRRVFYTEKERSFKELVFQEMCSEAQKFQLEEVFFRALKDFLLFKVHESDISWNEVDFVRARQFVSYGFILDESIVENLYREFARISNQLQPLVLSRQNELALEGVKYISEMMMEFSFQGLSLSAQDSALYHYKAYIMADEPTSKVYAWIRGSNTSRTEYLSDVINQALACSLLTRFCVRKKKELLEHILTALTEYKSEGAYPFPNVFTGLINSSDIPTRDREFAIGRRLQEFQGIFAEPETSMGMKERLFTALVEGRLGGRTIHLVDVLNKMYTDRQTSASWKARILVGLELFAGAKSFTNSDSYQYASTDPFVVEVRRVHFLLTK